MIATLFVESFQSEEYWSKGGLMIRDNLDDNAAYEAIFVGGGSMEMFSQTRQVAGEVATMFPQSPRPKFASHRTWLRLVKQGNYVTSYHKCDNCTTWERFSGTDLTFLSDGDFYVGAAVGSLTFDNVVATLSVSNFKVKELILAEIGQNGSPSVVFPLGRCEGDCDSDAECEVSFEREMTE